MSDFIKIIVDEVLQRGNDVRPIKHSSKPDVNSATALANIHRPNYQQQKREQRLSLVKTNHRAPSTSRITQSESSRGTSISQNNGITGNGTTTEQNFLENPLERFPSLAKITMSPISHTQVPSPTGKHGTNPSRQEAESMGTTKDGVRAWIFPEPAGLVANQFKTTWKNRALGIVSAEKSYPSQLFLVEEILKGIPRDAYRLEWSHSVNQPFVLELSLANEEELRQRVLKLYHSMNRRGLKQLESYSTSHPSAWLTKQLKLAQSVQAIGILESLGYYDNLYLLDRYLQRNPESALNFQVEKHYLLLAGEETSVKQALEALKKEASHRLAVR